MMEDWKEIKLKELISDMGDGGTPSTLIEGNFGGNIPWVVVDDVKPEIYSTKDCLTEQGFKSCSAKMWNEGTIILTTGATIGKVGIAKVPLCTKQGITGIVCNEYANNLFVRYWLEANEEQLLRYAQGTTFKEIRTRPLGNLRIMVPKPFTKESVDEQTVIANILSKVDEAIASVQGSIAAAERLKKSLMQNLLTGRMKPDGTFRKDDEFYMDEKFGKVPMGWEVKKGIEITSKITKGQSPKWQGFEYQSEGILFVTSENIRDGFIDVSEPKYLPLEFNNKIKSSQLAKGDVLINIVGASIGRCAIFDLDVECANTNQAVCVFRPNEENDSLFLSYYLQDDTTQKRLFRTQVETARANLSLGDFRKFKFVIPQKEEQIEIAKKIKQYNDIVINNVNKIATLERLKKSLMQNLLTGRVRVKVN